MSDDHRSLPADGSTPGSQTPGSQTPGSQTLELGCEELVSAFLLLENMGFELEALSFFIYDSRDLYVEVTVDKDKYPFKVARFVEPVTMKTVFDGVFANTKLIKGMTNAEKYIKVTRAACFDKVLDFVASLWLVGKLPTSIAHNVEHFGMRCPFCSVLVRCNINREVAGKSTWVVSHDIPVCAQYLTVDVPTLMRLSSEEIRDKLTRFGDLKTSSRSGDN